MTTSQNTCAVLLLVSWFGALPRVLPVAGAWQWTAVLATAGGVWVGIRVSAARVSRARGGRMSIAPVIALALALPLLACATNALGLAIISAVCGIASGASLHGGLLSQRSRLGTVTLVAAIPVAAAWALAAALLGLDVELALMLASGAVLLALALSLRAALCAPVPLNSRGESR